MRIQHRAGAPPHGGALCRIVGEFADHARQGDRIPWLDNCAACVRAYEVGDLTATPGNSGGGEQPSRLRTHKPRPDGFQMHRAQRELKQQGGDGRLQQQEHYAPRRWIDPCSGAGRIRLVTWHKRRLVATVGAREWWRKPQLRRGCLSQGWLFSRMGFATTGTYGRPKSADLA
jgi:hypothetical protein